MNLIFWNAKKRGLCLFASSRLIAIKNKIETAERDEEKYSNKDIAKDIEEVFDELELIQHKCDY